MAYPYFSFNSFINGSLILGVMGATMPLSERVPLSTCRTAVSHRVLVHHNFREMRRVASPEGNRAVKGVLAYTAGNSYETLHGAEAPGSDGSTVFAKGRSDRVAATILVLDIELVLQELESQC